MRRAIRFDLPGAMLLLGTLFWGAGFTWAKASIEGANRAANLPHGALFGPLFTLGLRFSLGAIVWFALFPAARRGWTPESAARALGLGALLAAGLIVQHLGLDRTSEAVSAFLTSLTILFVPILVTLTSRRPPRGVLWLGVIIAVVGVWMMTGAQPTGFGRGEILGLACSFAFALYILAVNSVVPNDSPWRMTGGQFLVVGVACLVCASLSPGGSNAYRPAGFLRVMFAPEVTVNILLLTVFATIGAFGLLTHFQPFVEPTRAALIYLFEPVVATLWAAVAAGRGLGKVALIGAALILAANVLAEILTMRSAAEMES